MRSDRVDGNDVMAVRAAVRRAAAAAREGEGPTFLEALTYRQRGHSRTDPGAYRPEGELERWLERDPITLFERALAGDGAATAEQLAALGAQVRDEMRAVTDDVMTWDDPDPAARFADVYA
jgi:acetoin:2,6-dichlorophenolindophenol oxidoreductase subunit alpha